MQSYMLPSLVTLRTTLPSESFNPLNLRHYYSISSQAFFRVVLVDVCCQKRCTDMCKVYRANVYGGRFSHNTRRVMSHNIYNISTQARDFDRASYESVTSLISWHSWEKSSKLPGKCSITKTLKLSISKHFYNFFYKDRNFRQLVDLTNSVAFAIKS